MEGDDRFRIERRTSVREVLRRYPTAAEVFERHGIMGCGGPYGPDEPLVFFALVHKVDPERLIAELQEHIASVRVAESRAPVDRRLPFAVLPIGLAVAAALGGIPLGAILALMAADGRLDARWTAAVQAHGQAQLMGWLGLFIVGMALHIVPRFKAVPLALQGLRLPTALAWAGAVALRAGAVSLPQAASVTALLAAAFLQTVAALLFAATVSLTLMRGRRESYDWFLLSALVWLAAGTGLQLAGAARARADGVPYVPAHWDAAALDALAYGFVLMFALGVSLRVVPFFLSLPPTRQRPLPFLVAATNLGLLLLTTGGVARALEVAVWTPLAAVGGAALAVGAGGTALALRVFSPSQSSHVADEQALHRKFVRAAYGWLLLALGVQAWLSVRASLGQEPGWLEAGAARHMLLLGFATQMVFGIAYRALPVFLGVRLASPRLADATFVLVNVAAITRAMPPLVSADGGGGMWSHVAGAGLPATAAVLLFGYNLQAMVVAAWRRLRKWEEGLPLREVRAVSEPTTVTADMTVAQVIERVPGALELLIERGFTPLSDPNLRAALAPTITLKGACELRGVDLDALLRDLNELARQGQRGEIS